MLFSNYGRRGRRISRPPDRPMGIRGHVYEMNQAILFKIFCTLLMVATGVALLLIWLYGSVDVVVVAIVFAGSLIGRCLLELRPAGDASRRG